MDKEILELLHNMAENINELKVGQKETNKRLDKIETDVKELNTEVKAIDKKIDTLYNAVAETKEDITYYIDEQLPNMYVDGGTAFSDGNNDYVDNIEYNQIIDCKKDYDLDLLPINSKGVYNGN